VKRTLKADPVKCRPVDLQPSATSIDGTGLAPISYGLWARYLSVVRVKIPYDYSALSVLTRAVEPVLAYNLDVANNRNLAARQVTTQEKQPLDIAN